EGDGDGNGAGQIIVRVGRYGPYLQRGDETVSIPEDLAPDELTPERAEELLSAPSSDRLLGEDPESGLPVYVKACRFGPYVQLGEMEQGADKPKTASLIKDMSPETVTIEDASRLLSLPRVLLSHPYVTDGTANASLRKGDTVDDITLERAAELLVERRQKAPVKKAAKLTKKAAKKKTAKKKATAKKAAAKKQSS